MCDFCRLPPGDHNKPYEFGRPELIDLRLTREQMMCLEALKLHVVDVRNGYQSGPAFGDIVTESVRAG